MTIVLKRIKRERFDSFLSEVLKNYHTSGEIKLPETDSLEQYSEPIIVSSSPIYADFNIEEYQLIVEDSTLHNYDKITRIGMKLHFDISHSSQRIPHNALYEKEFWTFLSFSVFEELLIKLRCEDEEKYNDEQIKRYFFNSGTVSRTGLFFWWTMVDRLDSESNYELTHTAFEFIDPVKAIFERSFSKNPAILRAFVQGIINNKKDKRFKNQIYRLKVPNNISCFAGVNILDAYEYTELVKVITAQQKEILDS